MSKAGGALKSRVLTWLLTATLVQTVVISFETGDSLEPSDTHTLDSFSIPSVPWGLELADTTPGVGVDSSLVLDISDNPHIAHYDFIDEVLMYTTKRNGTWVSEVVDDTDLVGESPSIAIDSKGHVHISYAARCPVLVPPEQQPPPDPKIKGLRYAVQTNSGWNLSVVDFSVWGAYPSLALDAFDRPHISYSDWNYGGLYYANWDGTRWQTTLVDSDGNLESAISMDSKGNPHIAYGKDTDPWWDLYYASWNGTSWKKENLGTDGFIITRVAMAMDRLDRPHVVWDDRDLGLRYATWNGSWKIDTLSGSHVGSPMIALHNDSPRIAYSYYGVYYGELEGSNWRWETINTTREFGLGLSSGRGLEVDSNGVPHLSAVVSAGNTSNLAYLSRKPMGLTADAGPDQTVNEGDTVYFDGTGSQGGGGGGTGKWEPRRNIPSQRTGGGSAVLNGEIYYVGGSRSYFDVGPIAMNNFQKYNPANDSWFDLPDLPAPRTLLGAAAVNGRIYAIGGAADFGGHYGTFDTTFEFDPLTNVWTWKAPMPTDMAAFGIAVLGDRIYTIGGISSHFNCTSCVIVQEYNATTDRWTRRGDMLTPRRLLSATALDGKIYAIAGQAFGPTGPVEVYDPVSNSWTKKASSAYRWGHAAEVLGGKIYMFGGVGESLPTVLIPTNETEVYDPSTDTWTSGPDMLEARVSFGSGVVGNCIYAVGGDGGIYGPPNYSEVFCQGGGLDYVWDFDAGIDSDGDGNFTNDVDATGPTPTYVYGDDGVFVVTLTVRDSAGNEDTDTMNVTVLNVIPSGTLSVVLMAQHEGNEIHFLAHMTDPGSDDIFLTWSWGDGTPDENSTYYNNGVSPDPKPSPDVNPRDITDMKTHVYGDNGAFTVKVFVRDDDSGNQGITLLLSATPDNIPPSVQVSGGMNIDEGQSIVLTATATDPGSDDLTFSWSWGEGSSESRIYYNFDSVPDPPQSPGGTFPFTAIDNAAHPYGDNGAYDVSVTVTDDDGGSMTWSGQVIVSNLPPTITPFGPSSVAEGSSLSVTASATDPGSDDLAFIWTFEYGPTVQHIHYNDGVGPDPYPSPWGTYPFSADNTAAHTYGDNGVFRITLKVEDDDGGVATYETSVTVVNVLPSGTLTITSSPQHEGFSIKFSAHVTDPGSDDIFLTWKWGCGAPDEYSTYYNNGTNPDPYPSPDLNPRDITDVKSHAYGDNGAFTVIVFVRDDDSGTSGTTLTITATPDNLPPSVTVSGGMSIDEGQSVILNATATDPGSDDLTFSWSWGEGSSESRIYFNDGVGPDPPQSPWGTWPFTAADIATHSYGDNGVFTVTLTVTDDDGGSTSWSGQVTVINLPPVIQPFGPFNSDEGSPFSVSASATDPGSDDLTFTWSFELGPTTSRTYYNNGVGPDPYPSPGPVYPFTASDGSTHTYGDNGIYVLSLTVTDDDGGSATYSTVVSVANLPPAIQPFGPFTIDEGSPLTVATNATDPGSDDLTFTWTFELGPTVQNIRYNDGTGPDPVKSPWGTFPFTASDNVTHTYGDNAVYALILTVTDDDGGSASYATNVTVVNLPPVVKPFGPFEVNEGDLLSITTSATDAGSDDLTFTLAFEYGPTIQHIYYNDGADPDPQKSPWGIFPFTAEDAVTHTYGDNGVFNVTFVVQDDDGGTATYTTTVTVHNVPPTILDAKAFVLANITLRVAGEKWHDVILRLYEDGSEVGYIQVIRYPGSPNDQVATIHNVQITLNKKFSAVAYYTPDDDPVNGQPNGANPAWIIINWENGDETKLHHTFNVEHSETWIWAVDNFNVYGVNQIIHLQGTAHDPGSDDLTFLWDSGDGRTFTTTYYNNGVSPDPYPSPDVNPITVTNEVKLVYHTADTYTITLTVTDDDGGSVTCFFIIRIG